MASLHAEHCAYGDPTICNVEKFDRNPRSWCGTTPSGCIKSSAASLDVAEANGGLEEDEGGFGAGARAPSGCWRIETSSSTSKAEAMGAMPGRVTVHC
jgi:hypothetical protein